MKKITLLITMLLIIIALPAQNCDELYQKGQNLLSESMDCGLTKDCIPMLENAKANFLKAKNCYFNAEKQQNCQFNIDLCNKQIQKINDQAPTAIPCKLLDQEFSFGAGGGESKTSITGSCGSIQGYCSWCKVKKNGSSIVISCDPNLAATSRTSVDYSINNQTISIQQSGQDCKLMIDRSELSFTNTGSTETIIVTSGSQWNYAEIPSWVTVKKNNGFLYVTANLNNSGGIRNHDMKVYNDCGAERMITLSQDANPIELSISQKEISFKEFGGNNSVQVSTDYWDWSISECPAWCVADKSSNIIQIRCMENPTTAKREGVIVVKAKNVNSYIVIKQDAKIIENNKNCAFYFNVGVGITSPSFSVQSSSVLSSVIDYSFTDVNALSTREIPDYQSNLGFNINLAIGIYLSNSLYLEPAINFSSFSLNNRFHSENELKLTTNYSDGFRYMGMIYDFSEKYSLSYFDIPIALNYKLALAKKISINFKTGPVFSFAVSGKGELSGNLNYNPIYYFDLEGNPYPGLEGEYYANSVINCTFNLFNPEVNMDQKFTTGQMTSYTIYQNLKQAPFKRFNTMWCFGVGFELLGLDIDCVYNLGITNIANSSYWEGDRIAALISYDDNEPIRSTQRINNYQHKIHTFEIRIGYTIPFD